MNALLFPAAPPVLADIAGLAAKFPVRRVFCVGRNYAEHAREMGRDPEREPPFFFTKWAETVVASGTAIAYPPETQNFHYEGELVVAVGRSGRNVDSDRALDYVFGYAAGLDMTRRDLQLDARAKGRPWDVGKNVEQSSPLGVIHPATECGHLKSGAIRLSLNGVVKQQADLKDLIWPVPDVIAFLSKYYTLEPGDVIYTGTPAGVGAVVPGDRISVHIDGLTDLDVIVGPTRA
jgi:fumarylpyruvate hydrolase